MKGVTSLIILSLIFSPIDVSLNKNNPGNIRNTGANWFGSSAYQDKSGFASFTHPVYGYRAMAKILLTYQRVHKLESLTDFISRYAPPSENPTKEYIKFVAKKADFTTFSRINLENEVVLFTVIKYMTLFEQGRNPDSDDIILAGVRMALNGN